MPIVEVLTDFAMPSGARVASEPEFKGKILKVQAKLPVGYFTPDADMKKSGECSLFKIDKVIGKYLDNYFLCISVSTYG